LPVGQGQYRVASGDCIISIAADHGHFWRTLWEAEENVELRELRGDPTVLMTGDLLHIPKLREKLDDAATGQTHRYRRRGIPAVFRIRLLFGGVPRAQIPFTLTIDSIETKGKTDKEGMIEAPMPPHASRGLLVLHLKTGDERMPLDFGRIEPVACVLGVQQRLVNLGIDVELTGKLDEATRSGIAQFQRREGMTEDGSLTDRVRSALVEAHGS
jgi:hypothetical protein